MHMHQGGGEKQGRGGRLALLPNARTMILPVAAGEDEAASLACGVCGVRVVVVVDETNGMHQTHGRGGQEGDEKHASGCLAGSRLLSLAKRLSPCVQAPKPHHGKLGSAYVVVGRVRRGVTRRGPKAWAQKGKLDG